MSYGVSDFVGGIASRRVAALRVVIISYPVALVVLVAAAAPLGGTMSTPAVVWGLLSGVGQAFGVWWFYAALGSGPISVVSPLTAILVAGLPVGVGLALGERPSALAGVGVVLALIAVVLVSREAPMSRLREENSAPMSRLREENSAPMSRLREENSAPMSRLSEENSAPMSRLREENSAPMSRLREENSAPMSRLSEENSAPMRTSGPTASP